MTPGAGSDRPFLLGLGALGLLAFATNVIASGESTVGLLGFDWWNEFLPRQDYLGRSLRSGSLPLWDPHQIAGLPFLATLQGGVLYPPNALYALMPAAPAMAMLAGLHVALTGLAMYGLCRELGSSRSGAALGGGVLMLCGSTLFLTYHPNAIHSAPWLPICLLATARMARPGRRHYAGLLALGLALQLLAGRDYTFVMTAYAVALFTAFQLGWLLSDGRGAAAARHAAAVAGAAALAAGLAAAQIGPTLELAGEGLRPLSGPDAGALETFGPYPPSLFLAQLVHPLRGPLRREYVGWIPWLLFLLSVPLGRAAARDRTAVFAVVLGSLALALTFGSQTPLFEMFRQLPLGASFRLPDRFLFLLAFAAALGASRGFDRWRRLLGGSEDARAAGPAAALALAFALAVAFWSASGGLSEAVAASRRPWGWYWFHGLAADHFDALPAAAVYALGSLALLAAPVAMARHTRRHRWLRAAPALLLGLAAADLLMSQANPLLHPVRRGAAVGSARECYDRLERELPPLARHLSLRLPDHYALSDKDGELFGTYSATHYDPLVTRRQAGFFAALQAGGAPLGPGADADPSAFMGFPTRYPGPAGGRLLDLLGVAGVLADGRERRPHALDRFLARFAFAGRCEVETPSGPVPIALYTSATALPRAFVVHEASPVADLEAGLRGLTAAGFDPRRAALVEGLSEPLRGPAAAESRAEITAYSPNRVEISVFAEAPGWLVLTDTWTPRWRARVDGAEAECLATDALFRGTRVPGGASSVVFEYRPRSFWIGSAISIASALAACATGLLCRRRARRTTLERG